MYDNFDSNKTFYTDSNGLEMQERILNFNPAFKWPSDPQNISGNFYPVDSAIAMRDLSKSKQITVMNNRAQAGAGGLSKGVIELIQHRRLLQDDNKGVQEILNETDKNGVGIKVNARYYVQVFDFNRGVSKQRQQQMLIEAPLQTFFSFESFKPTARPNKFTSRLQFGAENNQVSLVEIDSSASADVEDVQTQSLVYRAFPLARNQILVRFENIADRFDPKGIETKFIDVEAFSKNFQFDALKGKVASAPGIKFEEVSLSTSMTQKELDKTHFHWRGTDDDVMLKKEVNTPPADQGSLIALEPQRIR